MGAEDHELFGVGLVAATRPGISPITFALCAVPSQRDVLDSRSRTGPSCDALHQPVRAGVADREGGNARHAIGVVQAAGVRTVGVVAADGANDDGQGAELGGLDRAVDAVVHGRSVVHAVACLEHALVQEHDPAGHGLARQALEFAHRRRGDDVAFHGAAVGADRTTQRERREVQVRSADQLYAGAAAGPARHRHGFGPHVLEALCPQGRERPFDGPRVAGTAGQAVADAVREVAQRVVRASIVERLALQVTHFRRDRIRDCGPCRQGREATNRRPLQPRNDVRPWRTSVGEGAIVIRRAPAMDRRRPRGQSCELTGNTRANQAWNLRPIEASGALSCVVVPSLHWIFRP